MKRSEINGAIARAEELLAAYRWALPEWARWTIEDFRAHPDVADFLSRHQMGWDVTDFGSGDFAARGLTLFCARNGIQSDPDSAVYAEKLLVSEEEQETPFHCHRTKMEDIINRGGGTLVIEFLRGADDDDAPIAVRRDGRRVELRPGAPLRLIRGQSVTIERGLFHRFYAEAGGGGVLVGEVSQVNDDGTDNHFLEDIGRFAEIEEDEAPLRPLWNELVA